MPPAAAALLRIHTRAALTLGPSSPSPTSTDENGSWEGGEGGTTAALVGRISQLELLLKQALEQHNASEKENLDLRALLHSLGSVVAEQATPQLYHSMVLQLKLRQAEIAALQQQLRASQSGGLDLAAVSAEEAAVRQENKEMRQQLDNLAHHPHVRNLSTRFALLNAELTVKKVDYDYVHDARCSIQSYNRWVWVCVRACGALLCSFVCVSFSPFCFAQGAEASGVAVCAGERGACRQAAGVGHSTGGGYSGRQQPRKKEKHAADAAEGVLCLCVYVNVSVFARAPCPLFCNCGLWLKHRCHHV